MYKTFSKCTKTMYCKVQIKVCWHWSFSGKKHYKKLKRNPIAIENMRLHHRLKMHNLLAPPGAFISFFWKVWWDSCLRLENSIFVTPFRRAIKDQTENIGTATWWWLKTTTSASVIVTQSRRERRDAWWRNSLNYNIIFV